MDKKLLNKLLNKSLNISINKSINKSFNESVNKSVNNNLRLNAEKTKKHLITVSQEKLINKNNNFNYLNKVNDFIEVYNTSEPEIKVSPEMELKYFCYRFLDNIKCIKLPELSNENIYEAVLIEFRMLPHIEFIIRNNILKLGNKWSYTVVCIDSNYEFMNKICESISNNINIIKLQTEKNIFIYSDLWNLLKGDKILIYNELSLIYRNNIDKFINYNYIGNDIKNYFMLIDRKIFLEVLKDTNIDLSFIKLKISENVDINANFISENLYNITNSKSDFNINNENNFLFNHINYENIQNEHSYLIKYFDIIKDNIIKEDVVKDEKIKLLTIISTHSNTKLKYDTIKSNLKYFISDFNTIIIINSSNLEYNKELEEFYKGNNILYYECNNDTKTCDFGKWMYILNLIDYKTYDKILFTNDSFIIYNSINNFITSFMNDNYDLYGYNDSSEQKYHYQSYLFGIKTSQIYKLIDYYNSIKNKLKNLQDIINYLELELTNIYKNNNCYLHISLISPCKNIYFKNDTLYYILFHNNLLPFIKIKRILL